MNKFATRTLERFDFRPGVKQLHIYKALASPITSLAASTDGVV